MPAFIFISGYFSKRIPSIKSLIQGLVIPYFVYELVYIISCILWCWISIRDFILTCGSRLVFDGAICMACLLAPVIKKVPYHMPLLFAGGLLIGFVGLGNYLSIPSIPFFFPFFLWREWNLTAVCWNDSGSRQEHLWGVAVLTMLIIGLFVDDYHP